MKLYERARQRWLSQLRLEGKDLDDRGRMVAAADRDRTHDVDPGELPTCSVVRYDGGTEVVLSAAAGTSFANRVATIPPARFFTDTDTVADIVGAGRSITVERCRTYEFVGPIAPVVDHRIGGNRSEHHDAIVDGRRAGGASSVRSDERAAELWVYVEPEYRRHGLGRLLACAWAAEVLSRGKVAFYSHLADNEPSRKLARRLGCRPLFELINLTVAE